jgi:dTDP-4-dehydrorhamnose reductase
MYETDRFIPFLNSLLNEFNYHVQPHVIVNCAAISVPRQCETDPAAAMATNVPSSLVTWLLSFGNDNTLLIHLSTDQGALLSQLSSLII